MNSSIVVFCAALMHTPGGSLHYNADAALVVQNGRILFSGERSRALELYPEAQFRSYPSCVILPGLVDTHVHLPQWDIAGIGRGELLHWLNTYVFPAEARFADTDFAFDRSVRFFRDALSAGTTTLSVYSAPFFEATDAAFRAAAHTGVRVCMGRTLMDCHAPAELLASAERNIAESLQLANRWHNADDGRLMYTLTPRFALACTPGLLRQCGDIARSEGLRVQTHLAENHQEICRVAETFTECSSYAQVYEQAGLLGAHTILAHCIYLSPQERALLLHNGCAVAHCPSSNRFLQSGVMPLREYLHSGLLVGLGSDVGAGYSLSILHEACEAVETSKLWNIVHSENPAPVLSPEEALYLATLGGAKALGLDHRIGDFTPGKEADFCVVDLARLRPLPDFDTVDPGDLLARVLYSTHDLVARTFVRGKQVWSEEKE